MSLSVSAISHKFIQILGPVAVSGSKSVQEYNFETLVVQGRRLIGCDRMCREHVRFDVQWRWSSGDG